MTRLPFQQIVNGAVEQLRHFHKFGLRDAAMSHPVVYGLSRYAEVPCKIFYGHSSTAALGIDIGVGHLNLSFQLFVTQNE